MSDESSQKETSTGKKRGPNYSALDKEIYLSVINKFKSTIECKQSDAISSKQKNEAWKKITELYNSNVSQKRSMDQLQQLWRNLKKKAKEQSCSRRRENFATGGGKSNFENDPFLEKVEGLIPAVINPLENNFDDDRVLDYLTPKTVTKSSRMILDFSNPENADTELAHLELEPVGTESCLPLLTSPDDTSKTSARKYVRQPLAVINVDAIEGSSTKVKRRAVDSEPPAKKKKENTENAEVTYHEMRIKMLENEIDCRKIEHDLKIKILQAKLDIITKE